MTQLTYQDWRTICLADFNLNPVVIIELSEGYSLKYDNLRKSNKWTALSPDGRIDGDKETKDEAISLIEGHRDTPACELWWIKKATELAKKKCLNPILHAGDDKVTVFYSSDSGKEIKISREEIKKTYLT